MKITIVCDVLGEENNGTTLAAMNLIRALKAGGHQVTILCPDEEKKGVPGYAVVPTRNLGIFNGYVASNGVKLAKPDDRVIRQAVTGADIVHVMLPFILGRRGRSYIVVGPDALSIPLIHNLVQMLGAIPLGGTLERSREMARCVHRKISEGNLVTIYPEAHIWPFYTSIRPLKEASFGYPARDGAPVYTMTSCYQKRRFGPIPKVETYIDGPFYPDETLPLPQRKRALRDLCQQAMEERAAEHSLYTYYEYRQARE